MSLQAVRSMSRQLHGHVTFVAGAGTNALPAAWGGMRTGELKSRKANKMKLGQLAFLLTVVTLMPSYRMYSQGPPAGQSSVQQRTQDEGWEAFVSSNRAASLHSVVSQEEALEDPARRKMIDKIITPLKRESLEQSIDNLIFGTEYQYQWPGFNSPDKSSQHNLEVMLSNRRAVKVLQGIEKMPAKERALECRVLFAKAFQAHTNIWMEGLRLWRGSTITNSNSTLCTQLAVTLAMFVAADTGQRDLLADEFTQLDRFLDDFQEQLTNLQFPDATTKMAAGFSFQDRGAPDNQCEINLLRLAAMHGSGEDGKLLNQIEKECSRLEPEENEIPVVGWDARTTVFDAPWVSSPIDTSKGVMRYKFYAWHHFSVRAHQEEEQVKKSLRLLLFR